MTHKWEVAINRKVVEGNRARKSAGGEKIKIYIKPLSADAAFNKGVEYGSEIFFFYGSLTALAVWELRR